MAFGLYASADYIGRHGDVDFEAGCSGHKIIGQLNDVENTPQFGWLSDLTPRAQLAFQTSSHEAAVSAALHGAGLACLARFRADREDALVAIPSPVPAPSTGIWLVVHKDNRDTSRIRVVMNHIAETMRDLRAMLMPIGSAVVDPPRGEAEGPSDEPKVD